MCMNEVAISCSFQKEGVPAYFLPFCNLFLMMPEETVSVVLYVWHDSFICGTWLIHMWDMTHSYEGHDSFTFDSICCVCIIVCVGVCVYVYVCMCAYVGVWRDSYIYLIFCLNFLMQHTATHCNTLQHTATHCNTLQHTDSYIYLIWCLNFLAVCCRVLQSVAVCCIVLQSVAVCCSMLQSVDMMSQFSAVFKEKEKESLWGRYGQ